MTTGNRVLTTLDEEQAVRYLLREADEELRQRIEERLFSDDGYFEQVEALRDELINDYASNRMSAERRGRFEQLLRESPSLVQDAEFASTLRAAVTQSRSRTPQARSAGTSGTPRGGRSLWLAYAAGLLLAAAGAWIGAETFRTSRQVGRLVLENEALASRVQAFAAATDQANRTTRQAAEQLAAQQLRADRLEALLASSRPQGLPPLDFALTPAAFDRRVGGDQPPLPVLLVPPSADMRLRLEMPAESPGRRLLAELGTVEGNIRWSGRLGPPVRTPSDPPSVTAILPAAAVPTADYVMTLKTLDDRRIVSSYAFSVQRR